jgi:hypothetical protein
MRSLALLWLAALPAAAGESGGAGVVVAISLGAAAAVVGSGAAAFVLVRRRKQRRIQAFGPGPVRKRRWVDLSVPHSKSVSVSVLCGGRRRVSSIRNSGC